MSDEIAETQDENKSGNHMGKHEQYHERPPSPDDADTSKSHDPAIPPTIRWRAKGSDLKDIRVEAGPSDDVPDVHEEDLKDATRRAAVLSDVTEYCKAWLRHQDRGSGLAYWKIGEVLNRVRPIDRPRNSKEGVTVQRGEWLAMLKEMGIGESTSELYRHIAIRFSREEASRMGYFAMVEVHRKERRRTNPDDEDSRKRAEPSWGNDPVGKIREGVGLSHRYLTPLTESCSPASLSNADPRQLDYAHEEVAKVSELISIIKRDLTKARNPRGRALGGGPPLAKNNSKPEVRGKAGTLSRSVRRMLAITKAIIASFPTIPEPNLPVRDAISYYEGICSDLDELVDLKIQVIGQIRDRIQILRDREGN